MRKLLLVALLGVSLAGCSTAQLTQFGDDVMLVNTTLTTLGGIIVRVDCQYGGTAAVIAQQIDPAGKSDLDAIIADNAIAVKALCPSSTAVTVVPAAGQT